MTEKAETEAERRFRRLTNFAAAFVAVAGALTAIFSFTLTETGNRALRFKSEALDRKTQAVRHWSEHEAARTKRYIAELAILLLPADKTSGFRGRIGRLEKEQAAALARAQDQEKRADMLDDRSERLLEPRQFQIIALILLQISVMLGSIAILAKSRGLLGFGVLAGTGGTVLAIIGAVSL